MSQFKYVKFKYIKKDILDKVFSYIQKQLEQFKLSKNEIDDLKQKILEKCPLCILKRFIPNSSFEAFRIIVEYEGEIDKSFYPQLIINKSEREYVIKRYLIDKFLAYFTIEKLESKDEVLEGLRRGICELLAVSLFGKLKAVERLADRMKNSGKKVIEIRKGNLNSKHGEYNGNPFKPHSHVNWFPYDGINEWDIFSEVVKKY